MFVKVCGQRKECDLLETLKATPPSIGTAALDKTIDNQQAIGVIAGLYMGEGHFTITKTHGEATLTPHVGFTNADPGLIHLVCDWLDSNGIAFFMHTNSTNRIGKAGICWTIETKRIHMVKKILDLLYPYLCGNKKHQAAIVLRFVNSRLSHQHMNHTPYTDEEKNLYNERVKLRQSSETMSIPRVCKRDDIVQPSA